MEEEQLSLLGAVRKKRSDLEFRMQCALADYLRKFMVAGWRYTALPMGEHRTKATAARLYRMGVTKGWPDIMIVGPCVVWIELKRRGGRLSDEQIAMRSHLMRCGYHYLATDSVDDAVAMLKELGILPATVHIQ